MRRWSAWAAKALAGLLPVAGAAAPDPAATPTPPPRREFFFVGGEYVGEAGKQVMHGQIYVESLTPARVRHRYPIVLFHGAAQTATNWMGTPDGREGWADHFVREGYVVYMLDQPARGRSAWAPDADGPVRSLDAPTTERLFTAPEAHRLWPQAALHTQWPGEGPGKGRKGDPVFDRFYASQVQYLASNVTTEALVQKAGAALLDRIGPAVLLTHSQAGSFGWLIADARPSLVKGIVALEPIGPPFRDEILITGTDRPWGLSNIPLTYDPPTGDPPALRFEQQAAADGPGLVRCQKQADPVRKLPNLQGVPILILTSEASYHATYDHCTARYLAQAGVENDFVRLPDRGIRGNGHMMMLEKNSSEIVGLVVDWLRGHVPKDR